MCSYTLKSWSVYPKSLTRNRSVLRAWLMVLRTSTVKPFMILGPGSSMICRDCRDSLDLFKQIPLCTPWMIIHFRWLINISGDWIDHHSEPSFTSINHRCPVVYGDLLMVSNHKLWNTQSARHIVQVQATKTWANNCVKRRPVNYRGFKGNDLETTELELQLKLYLEYVNYSGFTGNDGNNINDGWKYSWNTWITKFYRKWWQYVAIISMMVGNDLPYSLEMIIKLL